MSRLLEVPDVLAIKDGVEAANELAAMSLVSQAELRALFGTERRSIPVRAAWTTEQRNKRDG